jgi:hypothetical protein
MLKSLMHRGVKAPVMNLDSLRLATPPWGYHCSTDLSSITNFAWKIGREFAQDLAVRILRGNKMRKWEPLVDEVSAALQFPYYCGENLNALDECLTDLEWLNAKGFLLVILETDKVLSDCADEDFAAFIGHLTAAASEWAKPVRKGQSWDREACPFHVLLHTDIPESERFRAKLQGCNLDIPNLELCYSVVH